ncbi:g166 [Coccomyxa viridis]|uniref:ribose-5-phosphate isomerase n=1 Tax=Coccomyxa viridis TaxID=1274662 RepID=A0ABP1FF20_9CHLO
MYTQLYNGHHQIRPFTSSPKLCRHHHQSRHSRPNCTSEGGQKDNYRKSAEIVVDIFLKDKGLVGLGNGPFAAQVIECIAEKRKLQLKPLQGFQFVPATDTAAVEAAVHGLPVTDLTPDSQVDLTILEVDQLDANSLACIIGQNPEGALPVQPPVPRLQQLLAQSHQLVALVSDPSKVVQRLSGDVPVFISAGEGPEDWEAPAEEVDDRFLGDAQIWRRSASGTANPRGGSDPYLSSNNEHILDIKFESSLRLDGRESCSYEDIAEAIEEISGVVAHGLVLKDHVTAVVHTPEGAQILRKSVAADAFADL